jgi:hypothetical protein
MRSSGRRRCGRSQGTTTIRRRRRRADSRVGRQSSSLAAIRAGLSGIAQGAGVLAAVLSGSSCHGYARVRAIDAVSSSACGCRRAGRRCTQWSCRGGRGACVVMGRIAPRRCPGGLRCDYRFGCCRWARSSSAGSVAVVLTGVALGVVGAFGSVAVRSGCRRARDAAAWSTPDGSVGTEPSQAALRGRGRAMIAYAYAHQIRTCRGANRQL